MAGSLGIDLEDARVAVHGYRLATRLERAWHDLQARARQEDLDLVTAAHRLAVERVVTARQLRGV